jgi:parallel beta-helix repeat protein
MHRIFLYAVLSVLAVLASACTAPATPPPFPEVRLDLPVPPDFELTEFVQTVSETAYNVTGDVKGRRFENCEVHIRGTGLTISESKFVNTQVFVGESREITFEKSMFEGLNQYERSALSINESDNITIIGCIFKENYIGLGIHSSSAAVKSTRFESNNGHNALVIGEGSRTAVSGNYFYGSFPHAMLIMNREGEPQAQVEIRNNVIEKTGEDAIDFEDYRDAAPSVVAGNVIVDTGWSAIIVEYNSWDADIAIRDNWIENTGTDWELPVHDRQPDAFQAGWGHGIFVEDASGVVIERNRITGAGENGIEIRNGRAIRVTGNGIDCAGTGIAAHDYHESSLTRPFSPLWPDKAGVSEVTEADNIIYSSTSEYEVNGNSELLQEQ